MLKRTDGEQQLHHPLSYRPLGVCLMHLQLLRRQAYFSQLDLVGHLSRELEDLSVQLPYHAQHLCV